MAGRLDDYRMADLAVAWPALHHCGPLRSRLRSPRTEGDHTRLRMIDLPRDAWL